MSLEIHCKPKPMDALHVSVSERVEVFFFTPVDFLRRRSSFFFCFFFFIQPRLQQRPVLGNALDL